MIGCWLEKDGLRKKCDVERKRRGYMKQMSVSEMKNEVKQGGVKFKSCNNKDDILKTYFS